MGAGASAGVGTNPIVSHIRMLFDSHDVNRSGELEWPEFWQILTDLDLGLTDDEIADWQRYADTDQSGAVKWSEFEPVAGDLIKKYYTSRNFDGEDPWKYSKVENRPYKLNLCTGENSWIQAGELPMGPHLKHMWQLFKLHDKDGSGELEWEEFWTVLNELGLELSDKDIESWQVFADSDNSGTIKWSEFEPMAEELIRQFYSSREYGGDDPWILKTDLDGMSYEINQVTGEYRYL